MTGGSGPAPAARRGGRRKGSGKRADASAPWELRAIQALADGSRWSIVHYVTEHEATIGAVARSLGLSMACTSRHLAILRDAGLIEIRRTGREAHCSLAAPGSAAAGLMRALGIAAGGAPAAALPARGRPQSASPELEPSGDSSIKRYQSNDLEDYLL
ncbi:MAG: metalloregulator ArsR/SmtB family transcription factor [Candidatus Eisenbacteria bacterium]